MAATAQPQQEKTLLMTEGSIWKSILLFSVPLILGNLLQQLYNTADSIIVGNFLGSNALAAVGSSGSPIYLLIGFSQDEAEDDRDGQRGVDGDARFLFIFCAEVLAHDDAGADGHALTETDEQVDG